MYSLDCMCFCVLQICTEQKRTNKTLLQVQLHYKKNALNLYYRKTKTNSIAGPQQPVRYSGYGLTTFRPTSRNVSIWNVLPLWIYNYHYIIAVLSDIITTQCPYVWRGNRAKSMSLDLPHCIHRLPHWVYTSGLGILVLKYALSSPALYCCVVFTVFISQFQKQ